MNWKYLNRRALYLHHIATSLKERFPSYEMHYEWLHDDCDKPVLVLALHILISPCPQVLHSTEHRLFLRLAAPHSPRAVGVSVSPLQALARPQQCPRHRGRRAP